MSFPGIIFLFLLLFLCLLLHHFLQNGCCTAAVIHVILRSSYDVYDGRRNMRLTPKTLKRIGVLVEAIKLFHRFYMIIIENENGNSSNKYVYAYNLKHTQIYTFNACSP